MKVDTLTNVNEEDGFAVVLLPVGFGPTFPKNPLVGELFFHDVHHNCIYTIDNEWRKLVV